MAETIDLAVLGRYLNRTADSAERAAVESWIGADPSRRAAVTALQAAWDTDAGRLRADAPYDVNRAWATLTKRLHRDRVTRGGRAPLHAGWRRGALVAAGLVAILVGGAYWLVPRLHHAAQVDGMREYASPPGRRAIFRLLDGTEITLNADSRLSVPRVFGDARHVSLDGEAYFNVAHDAAHPFLVHTAGGLVRDVGTAFGVRAYREDASERIAVVEGAVSVADSTETSQTPLRAGQVASRSAAGRVVVLGGASVTDAVAWTTGRLVFDNTPLAEAARQLGRWYDLDVRVEDSALAHTPVTGAYRNEPVTEVLTLLTSAVGARYDWRGRVVTITADR